MTPLWIHAAIAAAMLSAGFSSGWQTRTWKAGADAHQLEVAQQRDALRRAEAAYGAASDYEAAKTAQRVKVVTITREVERAVQADPGCSSQRIPDELRLALARAAADADQPIPDGAMPAASAASAFDLGRPGARLRGSDVGAGGLSGPASGAR